MTCTWYENEGVQRNRLPGLADGVRHAVHFCDANLSEGNSASGMFKSRLRNAALSVCLSVPLLFTTSFFPVLKMYMFNVNVSRREECTRQRTLATRKAGERCRRVLSGRLASAARRNLLMR